GVGRGRPMDSDDAARIDALTEAVADGVEVDWQQAASSIRSDEARDLIEQLRILDSLAKAVPDANDIPEPEKGPAATPAVPERASSDVGPAISLTSWLHFTIREPLGSGAY